MMGVKSVKLSPQLGQNCGVSRSAGHDALGRLHWKGVGPND
jgi:hypothetical protein